ncbi:MAG: HAD-IIB family hydrolase [Opitutales bacterium]|nr:HAD-IIB family hydrolase [Opitutales bacterium]MCH8540399.1 HAD-IIB family hydrolase [Opitutales bacterium]
MTLKESTASLSGNLTPPLHENPAFAWKDQPVPRQGVIVTDLDGTFLDRTTYSPAASLPMLRKALADGQIVVFCSSKTPSEQKHLQQTLGIKIPFICENGSAIYLPREDFPELEKEIEKDSDWLVIKLGAGFPEIDSVLENFEETYTTDLGRMSQKPIKNLASLTGLSEPAALRARSRLFSETLTAPLEENTKAQLETFLRLQGLKFECGGRFHTVTSLETDKGKAYKHLKALLQTIRGDLLSIGLGDSENDLRLLESVDFPVLVAKEDGTHEPVELEPLHRNKKPGPHGWSATIGAWLHAMA